MATLRKLVVKIGSDIEGLRSGLAKGGQLVKGWEAKIKPIGAAIKTGLIGAVNTGIAVATSAIAGLGASLLAAGVAGFSMNNAMEQARATINAFTKDNEKTDEILAMVQERAAKTPFAFQDYAASVGGLIPVANQAGVELESLLQDAEILAASNPAEGLEGATFALREAVSGDFTSIIERFNLPRQYINQLKEEGVPSIEIVRRAMAEMGYDTDLVSSLAETAQGRWSTLKDTLQNLAATVTEPIFDEFSQGLGFINELLDQNAPKLQTFAKAVGEELTQKLKDLKQFFIEIKPELEEFGKGLAEKAPQKIDEFIVKLTEQTSRIQEAVGRMRDAFGFSGDIDEVNAAISVLSVLSTIALFPLTQLADTMEGIVVLAGKVKEAFDVVEGISNNLQTIDQLTGGAVSTATSQASAYFAVTSPTGTVQQTINLGEQLGPYFDQLTAAFLSQPPPAVEVSVDGQQVASVITPRVSAQVGQQVQRNLAGGGVRR